MVINILLLSYHCTNGAEYFLGFIPHFDKHPTVIMTTTESAPVYYRIEAPGMNICLNGTILPNMQNTIDLPGNLTGKSNTFPDAVRDKIPKGIYLKTSSEQVTVIGQNGGANTIDTFLAVPIRNLCLHQYVYYPFSVASYVQADASIAIVGTEDETTLTITPSVNSKISLNSTMGWSHLHSGEYQTYMINKLQTVYLSAYLIDLTGTKIVADKPLSVISGHECAFVPTFVTACDHLIEQMLPTELWGTTYYVAPLASRSAYTLKFITASNNTNVTLTCNGVKKNILIDGGEFHEEVLRDQEYCAIHSNKNISVVQLSHGFREDGVGDPMMTLIPAVNDYSNKIISSTNHDITHTNYKQYVNVITKPEYYQPELLYLNARGINQTLQSYNWTPIVVKNITEAYAAQVYLNFTEQVFQITHLNKAALISGILYGFLINPAGGGNSREGYGHPAGFNIIKKYSKYHFTCPASDSVNNRIVSASDFMCDCTSQIDCTPVVDNCSPNPCQNSGTCIDDGIDFTCICPPGFIGENCGISIDDCFNKNNPCQNNGTCVDLPVDYLCICAEGYTGRNCSATLPCNSNPCLNNAYCVDHVDDYICICPDGYTGKDCNTPLHCSSNPCQNNGTCIDTLLSYICDCGKGFAGDICDNKINDCSINPCKNNGICVYANGSFQCNCPSGFDGLDCSIMEDIKDKCNPNPCQNGGNCTIRSNIYGFTCLCDLEYMGSYCELKRTIGVCQNRSVSSVSSPSSSSDEYKHFGTGFVVGLATGIIVIIIFVLILVLLYKKYFKKQCTDATSSFGMAKLENQIDDSGCDDLACKEISSKDKPTLVK